MEAGPTQRRPRIGIIRTLMFWVWMGWITGIPAGAANLFWSTNGEPSVVGYRVYQGFRSGAYVTSSTLQGRDTDSVALELWVPGETYYFSLTAFDTNGLESEFSNEVSYTNAPAIPGMEVVSTNLTLSCDRDQPVDVRAFEFAGVTPEVVWLADPPAYGSLEGPLDAPVYTPGPGYTGNDSFRLLAVVGGSKVLKVRYAVRVLEPAPRVVARDAIYPASAGDRLPIVLVATGGSGRPLEFDIRSGPSHGRLEGVPPVLTYIPDPGFLGTDEVVFVARDGTNESSQATVVIHVAGPPPESVSVTNSVVMTSGMPLRVEVSWDGWGDIPLVFETVESPAQGTLSEDFPSEIYTPKPGFRGRDRIAYRLHGERGSTFDWLAILDVGAATGTTQDAGCALWSDGRLGLAWRIESAGSYEVGRWDVGSGGVIPVATLSVSAGQTHAFWNTDIRSGASAFYVLRRLSTTGR